MAIIASANNEKKELIPAGNYIARCYQMIHLGTLDDNFKGKPKKTPKVRIGWELPTEQKIFKEENGLQPLVVSKEFSLYMNDNANLRKTLASWRGKDFSEDEIKSFDITKLVGVPCMLNIIHKPSKDGTKMYEEVSSITPLPKGVTCPPQINETLLFEHDNPNFDVLEKLPNFIKDKIYSSYEWRERQQPGHRDLTPADITEPLDDLPF